MYRADQIAVLVCLWLHTDANLESRATFMWAVPKRRRYIVVAHVSFGKIPQPLHLPRNIARTHVNRVQMACSEYKRYDLQITD